MSFPRLLALLLLFPAAPARAADPPAGVKRHLYVVTPGIRDYLQFGGAGILVFDIDAGHTFVKRIDTPASRDPKPDNIKGVCACPATRRLYFTTRSKLYCVDLVTEKTLWEKALPNGTDRMSVTPDGKLVYVPSFEKDTWNVVDAATGDVITAIETKSGAHNTVVGLDGSKMYMGGLKSPLLFVADTATHKVVMKAGPFGGAIRPFVVNGEQTRAYVCVNDLLGFEVGDLTTGKLLHRVEVKGFARGPVKRHGCPSHGVGLTPDEKEVWVVDAFNQLVHVFDNTTTPPTQKETLKVREQPGWVTFSLDGKYAYPSTGEVFDTATKKMVTALTDEQGREVHSEKMVEIHFRGGVPVAAGDQFGVGRVRGKTMSLKYVEGRDGDTAATVVGDVPLVHTAQVLGADGDAVLTELDAALQKAGADPRRVARLNVGAATPAAVEAVAVAIRNRYPAGGRPTVTFVVGKLPRDAQVGIDAVAVADAPTGAGVLPAGPKVYVAGQAEKGATPAEAAANTIASLKRTLAFLGCQPADAVQAKCFLTPMSAAADVAREFDKAFGPGKVPLVFVEWHSTLPIEIELIAKAPPAKGAEAVEYLTPPGMTASPVYSRVARVNRGSLVYTCGLASAKPGSGEEQVLAIFDELKGLAAKTGTDLRHLVKATYYVSGDDPSQKLNDLRPRFYDPKRPPAASKAMVPAVGAADRGITIDMIAVAR